MSRREEALAEALQLVLDDWANSNVILEDAMDRAHAALAIPSAITTGSDVAPQEGAGSTAGPAAHGEPAAATSFADELARLPTTTSGSGVPLVFFALHPEKRDDLVKAIRNIADAQRRAWHLEAEIHGLREASVSQSATLSTRDEIIEECARAIDSAECLPKCDSFGHEELCPVVNPEAAIRALKSHATDSNAAMPHMPWVSDDCR